MSEIENTLSEINEAYGDGTVFRADCIPPRELIPTGIFLLDFALCGGLPEGLAAMVYGYESCLAGDTFIQYQARTKDGKIQNSKGGSIERLHERFHGIERKGAGYYQRAATKGAQFFVPAVNEEGRVIMNPVLDVVATGERHTFRLTTETGETIVATAEHKFFTGSAFVPLSELQPGDSVMLHNGTRFSKEHKAFRYAEISVKYHPSENWHRVNGHRYARVRRSRAVVEAAMNGLTLDEYRERLNSVPADIIRKRYKTLPAGMHVHHRNENFQDDSLENLEVMPGGSHNRQHALKNHNLLRFMAVPAVVKTIVPDGVKKTFDVKCPFPHNNYVADKFVVHNSGKSLLCSLVVANYQRKHPDKVVGWLDMEGTYDPTWAATLGVDPARIYVAQPKNGQQGVDTMIAFMDSAECGLVVGDSVPSFVPQRVVAKSAEEDTMGELARLMGILSSKITTSWADQRQKGHRVTVLLVNQWRTKLGFVMGDPRTLPGGRQINHMVTTKIELKKLKEVDGRDEHDLECVLRTEHAFKIAKYKLPPSVLQGEFTVNVKPDLVRGLGAGQVDNVPTLVTYAKKLGLITGGGSKWVLTPLAESSRWAKDCTFNKRESIELYLSHPDNADARLHMMQAVLEFHRASKALPPRPPDGYLFGRPSAGPEASAPAKAPARRRR